MTKKAGPAADLDPFNRGPAFRARLASPIIYSEMDLEISLRSSRVEIIAYGRPAAVDGLLQNAAQV